MLAKLAVCSSGIATSHPENTPAGSVSIIWYTGVHCIGSEEDIRDCALSSPGFTDHNYGYSPYSHEYQSYRYPSTRTYSCPSLAGVHCSVPFTPRPGKIKNKKKTSCIVNYDLLESKAHCCSQYNGCLSELPYLLD